MKSTRIEKLTAIHVLFESTVHCSDRDVCEIVARITGRASETALLLASANVVLNLRDNALDVPLIELLARINAELPDDPAPAAAQAA